MSESSKKIRELTKAMCAERNARIRNRMMVVPDVLKGTPQRPPLILQTWTGTQCNCELPGLAKVASGTLPGGAGCPAQDAGGS